METLRVPKLLNSEFGIFIILIAKRVKINVATKKVGWFNKFVFKRHLLFPSSSFQINILLSF